LTPEGKVKKMVKEWLDEIGAYYFWPVQTGYGARTLDCLVCYKGKFFGIETKAKGKKPTKFQQLTINEMEAAGATVFTVSDEATLNYAKSIVATYYP
jgi:hypothetical protein